MDDVYKKLIQVTADTTGLQKLDSDLTKAQLYLNGMGKSSETVTKAVGMSIPVMDKYGKVSEQSMLKISTASGKTFEMINRGAPQSASAMGDFERALRRAAIVAPVWMALRMAMQGVFSLIQEQSKFLVEMETALAHIQIVGKGTTQEYSYMKIALIGLAQAYGTSASEAVEAATTFAQQGKTVAETIQLTRLAMIGSQTMGMGLKETVNALTAAIEGFNLPINESAQILDKWINVERQYAVTATDLAEATKRAGATANQLGITIDSFLGHVTGIIEVTRKSGTEAGNSLQFMYSRILTTGAKVISSIARVPVYMDASGKAVQQNTGIYRSAGTILDEVAAKWDNLTQKQKLDIAQGIASRRQMTAFMALMQNYDRAVLARVDSLSSAGQAEKALQIIMGTTAYKAKQLTSSWNLLTTVVANTAPFKESLDMMSKILIVISSLIDRSKVDQSEMAKANAIERTNIETKLSSIANFKELIKLRDVYSKAPQSNSTIAMVKAIDMALNKLTQVHPRLGKVDFTELEVANKKLDEFTKLERVKEIVLSVREKYAPEVATIKSQMQMYEQGKYPEIKGNSGLQNVIASQIQYKKWEQEIIELGKAENAEIDKQVKGLTDKNGVLVLTKEEAEAALAEETKLTDMLINAEIEKLKLRGASAKTLLEQETRLHDALGIQLDNNDLLKRKLSLEQEITREKLHQNKVTSDQMKIFEVSQKYGSDVAIDIAKVLQGGKVESLSGKSLEAFKTEFADMFKDYQAKEFYKTAGVLEDIMFPDQTASLRYLMGLRDKYKLTPELTTPMAKGFEPPRGLSPLRDEEGRALPQDFSERGLSGIRDAIFQGFEEAKRSPSIINQTIPVQVESQINVNIDSESLVDKVLSAFKNSIDNPSSGIAQALNRRIKEQTFGGKGG
jgi:TP901 family phage tail tape measure protein